MIFIENKETCLQKRATEKKGGAEICHVQKQRDLLTRDAERPSQFNVVAGEDAQ